ncbi:YceI-like domain-containing protein [Salegentibacter holothuriorum]|uniref:YceI-like domain-containing protein n=1 Tax=Salegentibacter holothuriorum TaxID=241145 RepID=A0A1T5C6U9_9FLAO|nr:YceI family protein [Salegentibacter holothuriorum]SKB55137.1 YceI-like domain-containing protein [Salegentibacter holothuriorum]
MKTYFLFLFALFLSFSGLAQTSLETREIVILPNSSLSIAGTTNINEFKCDFNPLSFKNESFKVHYIDKERALIFKNSILTLENKNFDCGHRKINKDFHDLLKTEKYPEIFLKIKKIDLNKEDDATVTLSFTIAGIENDYRFPIEITWKNEIRFEGKLELNIKDFNLQAPTKIFGLIVIDEEIEIDFNLNIKT